MSAFFRNLFGKHEDREPVRDVAALAEPLGVPAVHVVASDMPSTSHFGGVVQLPPGIARPSRNGEQLTLLARLALADVQRALAIPWLPRDGSLLFFYDVERQPWGFDPKDRGGWAVLYVPDLEIASVDSEDDGVIPLSHVEFRSIRPLPSWERASVEALQLNDEEFDAFVELGEAQFDGAPKHQVGGCPDPVQGDVMELEAQLASHGEYVGEPSDYETARAKQLAPGAANWKLLLQFDTDDDLDVMWGDSGKLYFWVEEERARAGDFTNVWLVLQCG